MCLHSIYIHFIHKYVHTFLLISPQDKSQTNNMPCWNSIPSMCASISFERKLKNMRDLEVAKPDFGSLLKAPHDVEAGNAGNGVIDTGPQIGTILWYNGRRKSGILLADRDHSQLRC